MVSDDMFPLLVGILIGAAAMKEFMEKRQEIDDELSFLRAKVFDDEDRKTNPEH